MAYPFFSDEMAPRSGHVIDHDEVISGNRDILKKEPEPYRGKTNKMPLQSNKGPVR
jgi:hypothetical protein